MMDSENESSDEDDGPASKRTKMAASDSESDEDVADKTPVTKANGKSVPVTPKDEDVIKIVKQRLEEQHKRSLYVRGIPKKCTPSMLKDLATQMTTCNIPSCNHGKKSRGYCFMEFKTPEIATSMIAKLNGKSLGGNKLVVKQATPKGDDLSLDKLDLKTIYITGLVKEVKETHVKALFPKALKVSVETLAGGICAGTSVVTFGNVNHARAAFNTCHKKVLLGNPISITYIIVRKSDEKKQREDKKDNKKDNKAVLVAEKSTPLKAGKTLSSPSLKKQSESPKVTEVSKKAPTTAVKVPAQAAKKKDESESDDDDEDDEESSDDETEVSFKKVNLDEDKSDEDDDESDEDDSDEDDDSDEE